MGCMMRGGQAATQELTAVTAARRRLPGARPLGLRPCSALAPAQAGSPELPNAARLQSGALGR